MAVRLETRLEGPVLVQPEVFRDERGFFHETYRRDAWAELGIDANFVQDNHSRSWRGVVRGMHFQTRGGPRDEGQAKLVRCVRGAVLDVVVDIRRGSPTFGECEAFELSDENLCQLFCPVGFAHGFCVLSEEADVAYRCDAYYDPESGRTIAYDDPDLAIEWPEGLELRPSAKDARAPRLRDVAGELPFEYQVSRQAAEVRLAAPRLSGRSDAPAAAGAETPDSPTATTPSRTGAVSRRHAAGRWRGSRGRSSG